MAQHKADNPLFTPGTQKKAGCCSHICDPALLQQDRGESLEVLGPAIPEYMAHSRNKKRNPDSTRQQGSGQELTPERCALGWCCLAPRVYLSLPAGAL